jgi:hypothetical protein
LPTSASPRPRTSSQYSSPASPAQRNHPFPKLCHRTPVSVSGCCQSLTTCLRLVEPLSKGFHSGPLQACPD